MRKNRVIGFAAAAIVALGLTSGVASAAGAFSGGEAGSDGAKPTKQYGSTATEGKDAAKPEGVAVQRTKDGMKVRKLTKEELENMDGAKPTKALTEDSATDKAKSDK
uniref:Uncharacterized protein n=1 Tax=Streptomyces sp. NBC_01401 TaxID=2903854 RepID=A0AAU3H3C2_9ACTN